MHNFSRAFSRAKTTNRSQSILMNMCYLNSAYSQSSDPLYNSELVATWWGELGRVVVDVSDKNRDVDSRTLQGRSIVTCIS